MNNNHQSQDPARRQSPTMPDHSSVRGHQPDDDSARRRRLGVVGLTCVSAGMLMVVVLLDASTPRSMGEERAKSGDTSPLLPTDEHQVLVEDRFKYAADLARHDLRTWMMLVEAFAHRHGYYPGFKGQPLPILEALRNHLSPEDTERLPGFDPWCNPYEYWTDGDAYFIRSVGVDGAPEPALLGAIQMYFYGSPELCTMVGDDLVAVNGRVCDVPTLPPGPSNESSQEEGVTPKKP